MFGEGKIDLSIYTEGTTIEHKAITTIKKYMTRTNI